MHVRAAILLSALAILAAGCGGATSGAHTNLQNNPFIYPVATQSVTSNGGTFAFAPCTGPPQSATTQLSITLPQSNIPAGLQLKLTSIYCIPPPCIGCNPPLGTFSFLNPSTGAPAVGTVTFNGNVLLAYQTTASNVAMQIVNGGGSGAPIIATCLPATIPSGSIIFSCSVPSLDLSTTYSLFVTSAPPSA